MAEKLNEQKSIQVLESDVEAVRKLPDVYIGSLGNAGFKNMYREILQNSLDVIMKRYTNNLTIVVSYDMRNHTVIVEDNGPGLPLDMVGVAFSVLHASSNYDKTAGSGEYSSGKNGMGGTIVNYLSKLFQVETFRADGTAKLVKYQEGVLTEEKKIKCPKGKTGLRTIFTPSDMVGNITLPIEDILNLTWMLCNLCRKGTTILFNWIDNMNHENSKKIVNTKGIYEIMDSVCEKTVITPIYYTEDNGTTKIEFLMSYDIKNMDEMSIVSFVNSCPTYTVGSTHVEGFVDGVVKFFRDYMNKIYLVNNKKLQVTAPDIRTGLRAVVSGWHLFPLFTGQSKEVFSKEDMKPFVYKATVNALTEWSKNNPADLQKICKYLKEVCEIRIKSEGEKIKLSDKFTASVVTGLPQKYIKPNGKGPFEVLIVEGDSCRSAAENNRNKLTQGIYPIRGKILNACTTPPAKMFANAEIVGLLKIMGYTSYSKKFDPDKFKPEKIIIATDADADGSHIESLLMMFFLKYFPFVIEQGKLYGAQPPLYGMKDGKNGMRFFRDNIEYVSYVQDLFCRDNKIHNKKNVPMTKKEILKVLYDNKDYAKMLNTIADNHSIDPKALETVLLNYDKIKDFPKFKKAFEKEYRFIKITLEDGVPVIEVLINDKIHTIICGDWIKPECKEVLRMLDKADSRYIINNNKCTLYNLITLFNAYEPEVTRYKGLGEMPPNQLGISTIIPGMGRTLRQYTIDDVVKQLNYVKDMQTDKSAFLKDIGTIRREDII